MNVTEANALGVPAVAYNVPGLCDSVRDGETGFLTEADSYERLACKTLDVLLDSSMRERLSMNALEYSRQFDWDKTANEFGKLITNG